MTLLSKIPHIVSIILTAFAISCTALSGLALAAEEEEDDTLALYSAWQQESSTASRAPKPLSQTPENITIVTASDIEALNAHTLADVLYTIPGVQTEHLGLPGSIAYTYIQGSQFNHVLILVDGVPLNNGDNFSDVSLVPAQIIERIEVIKGAASSAWGQALGGVINVITKSPEKGRIVSGSATTSLGLRTTADSRAELSGTSGRLGYYLSGGYLGSNGLRPNNSVYANNLYSKLTYDLPKNGLITATFRYALANREDFSNPYSDYRESQRNVHKYATLNLRQPLTEKLEMDITARHADRGDNIFFNQLSDNALTSPYIVSRDLVSGGAAKLIWRGDNNIVVAGGEYVHAEFKSSDAFVQTDLLNRKTDRWGVYLNDTINIGPVSLVPGVRYDQVGSYGSQFSPSFGAVWRLTDTTLIRGYVGRGYSLTTFSINRPPEKVLTTQMGMESSAVPYLWLKGTIFRNDMWNVQIYDGSAWTTERRITLGTELEARTVPVFNTSLGTGYTFTETTRSGESAPLTGTPRHTLHMSLRYDDKTFRGIFIGRHIYWNGEPTYNGRYYGVVWDLHLGAKVWKREDNSLELFFSARNLFNNNQYQDELKPNPSRYFEGGARLRF